MLNAQQIASCAGAALKYGQLYADGANAAMDQFQINTPARQAAFLAQCGHETIGLSTMVELWGPTAAQTGYEGRADLGNTQSGDGFLYRGRGWIQLTGRANYTNAAGALCLDCVNNPAMIAKPEYAPLVGAWFWQTHGLNELADAGNFSLITRRINGGLNGIDDRMARWSKAKQVLGVK